MALTNMSAEAAKLELMDNDQSSRRLKRAIINFKNKELADFEQKVSDIRDIIKSRKKKTIKNSGINMNKAIEARSLIKEGNNAKMESLKINKEYDF